MPSKFVLGDGEPPEKWIEPWEYEAWKAQVLKDETMSNEALLQALYAEQWEPTELYKALSHGMWFDRHRKPKKSRQVVLDLPEIDRRIAKAIWVECSRLLMRRMTVDARKRVCELQIQMEKAAGIEVYGRD